MAVLRINTNDTFEIDTTVRESDEYSESIYVRFDRQYISESEGRRGTNELFLTPTQLDHLGRFFIRQAEEIRTAQNVRKRTS